MKLNRYFPLGKAYGDAFCNRTIETKKLVSNISRGVHTYLVAPRRYGKSSLCERAFIQSGFQWAKVDFHLSVSEKDSERLIIKGVLDLIGKSISQIDKLSALIKNSLKHLKPKFDISAGPFSLELEVTSQSSPAENVADALLLLDKLLRESNKNAVLLFDEFQEVGQVSKGKGIEGAIRHAAQETENLSIIFSGSNPHMINSMFENDRRPLYKLCKKLSIFRINFEHYKKHLDIASNMAWGKNLPETIFKLIMTVTERHPYYVNALCDEIWSEFETIPSRENILDSWDIIIEGERSDLVKDFLRLSDNQRKILIHIANFTGEKLFSLESSNEMGMAPGSLHTAVSVLLERDYIERINDTYGLVVPVYKQLLKI